MDLKLAKKIRDGLIDGKVVADHIRDMPPDDPNLPVNADHYVTDLYAFNELLSLARPWQKVSIEGTAGVFSVVAGTVALAKRERGAVYAGVFVVGWFLMTPVIQELRRRLS